MRRQALGLRGAASATAALCTGAPPPGRLGFAKGVYVGGVAGEPGFKFGLLPGQRALQGDQPVEGLVHSHVLQHLMSQLMGVLFIRVRHGVPRVFATFCSSILQRVSIGLPGSA